MFSLRLAERKTSRCCLLHSLRENQIAYLHKPAPHYRDRKGAMKVKI